jgi:SlyX protein
MDNNRITDIETKISYLERLISELNDVVYEQQKTIDHLEKKCHFLIDRMAELSKLNDFQSNDLEKPPHY